MQIAFPSGLFLIFFSLASFYYFNQKNRMKRDESRERLRDSRQAWLDSLLRTEPIGKDAQDREIYDSRG